MMLTEFRREIPAKDLRRGNIVFYEGKRHRVGRDPKPIDNLDVYFFLRGIYRGGGHLIVAGKHSVAEE